MKKNKLYLKNYISKSNFGQINLNKQNRKISNIISELNKDLNNSRKTINVLSKNFKFNFQVKDLSRFKKFKKIALIGMGGSILGSEAIYNFLSKKIKKKIYFFNNLDNEKLLNFKKEIKLRDVLFLIISKSGDTMETLTNSLILNILKKNKKNIIIITEKKNSLLLSITKKLKLFFIEHKQSIGGRYSVLSEVGMVPAHLMGLSITSLRAHILDFFRGNDKLFLQNSAIKLANILKLKKINNLVFINYSPNLEKFLFWCQQLIAESLGKKGRGFLPIISNVPKDHHSLLQLYLDGPKDKLFYVFSLDEKSKDKINLGKIINHRSYLNKKTLNQIKLSQKKALIKAFVKENIPFREFRIGKIDEKVLGKLFAYFIIETIVVGKLVNINPFDQPAVEQVKIYTKKLLN